MGTQLGRALSRQSAQQQQPPSGSLSLQTGTVNSWSEATGFVIELGGSYLSDVPILSSSVIPQVGDTVAVLRQKTNVLILGVITTPS